MNDGQWVCSGLTTTNPSSIHTLYLPDCISRTFNGFASIASSLFNLSSGLINKNISARHSFLFKYQAIPVIYYK